MAAQRRSFNRIGTVMLAALLLLAGCKETLYSNLPENEANEMVALLDAGGISAGRERTKDGTYNLLVDGALVASSVTLLQSAGYPKQRFQSLGDVFSSDELTGSPFSERARYMHAMNEELSRTITEIDGVRSARVQVMIPAQDKYDAVTRVAKASVAIVYDGRRDLAPHVPVIKTLVAHSVPDLTYDNVSVALFPVLTGPNGIAEAASPTRPATRAMSFFPLDISPLVLGLVFGLLLSAIGAALMALLRRAPSAGTGRSR